MADALKVEAAVAITAAANPVTMLRIMMLLLLLGDAPQPLSAKLGSSHWVAACGIVARCSDSGTRAPKIKQRCSLPRWRRLDADERNRAARCRRHRGGDVSASPCLLS